MKYLHIVKVNSSFIGSVKFTVMDNKKMVGTLVVTMINGKKYAYTQVPYPLFKFMTYSQSVGKFFNQHIKPHHHMIRI